MAETTKPLWTFHHVFLAERMLAGATIAALGGYLMFAGPCSWPLGPLMLLASLLMVVGELAKLKYTAAGVVLAAGLRFPVQVILAIGVAFAADCPQTTAALGASLYALSDYIAHLGLFILSQPANAEEKVWCL
jgi:hypothetical protein